MQRAKRNVIKANAASVTLLVHRPTPLIHVPSNHSQLASKRHHLSLQAYTAKLSLVSTTRGSSANHSGRLTRTTNKYKSHQKLVVPVSRVARRIHTDAPQKRLGRPAMRVPCSLACEPRVLRLHPRVTVSAASLWLSRRRLPPVTIQNVIKETISLSWRALGLDCFRANGQAEDVPTSHPSIGLDCIAQNAVSVSLLCGDLREKMP